MAFERTTGPVNNPSRRIFASYFRARWQNFQNTVNRSEFYADMPSAWVTYQQNYVKQWDEWSRGFVPALHRGDFFATGTGKTVIDILTRECIDGGFRIDGDNPQTTAFIERWRQEDRLDQDITGGFAGSSSVGNVLLKLTVVSGAGEVYPTVHPINQAYMTVNRKGEVIVARFKDMMCDGTAKDEQWFAVDERVMHNGVPYYRIRVQRFYGQATFAQMQYCGYEQMDEFAQSVFTDLYGDIQPDKWYRLPFKTLGVWNWKAKEYNQAITAMTGYSESALHTSLDILYAIDYNYTMGQLDQYYGRTRVIVPKTFQTPKHVVFQGQDYGEAYEDIQLSPLEADIFTEAPGTGVIADKPQQPLFMQPELRQDARKALHDHYLQMLASKVGLSATTLANHLTYNKAKTATEVDTEEDTTDKTVYEKRMLANVAINGMLEEVVRFYGLDGKVQITWNKNGDKRKSDVMDEYSRGVMPLDECVKRLHPELTAEEVAEWVEKLKVQQPQQQADEGFDFGLGDEY